MRLICLIVLIFLFTGSAQAQKRFQIKDFRDKPFADAREDYFDLLRQIFGESIGFDEERKMPTVNRSFDLRKLFIFEEGGEEENSLYEAPLAVSRASGWRFEANGEKHFALLLKIEKMRDGKLVSSYKENAVLAVFRVRLAAIRGGGKLELVEAVDPQTDRYPEFADDLPLIKISRGNEAFWIENYHWNAGENYTDYAPIAVVGAGNRLSLAIENIPSAYTNFHCADGSEQFFSVEPLKRKLKNSPPYNFVLTTFSWREKDCIKAGRIIYTSEEDRIYRAVWTRKTKTDSPILQARQVKIYKKRVRITP